MIILYLAASACVAGEMECNRTACLMILSKVVEDPQSGSCLNVSYADVSGPVANYNPTGSPYANHNVQHTPVQGGNFNSSPSLSSSITAGKLMVRGSFVLQKFRTYHEDLYFSLLLFERFQSHRPCFQKYNFFPQLFQYFKTAHGWNHPNTLSSTSAYQI